MKNMNILRLALFLLSGVLGWLLGSSSEPVQKDAGVSLTPTKSSLKASTKSRRKRESSTHSKMRSLSALASEKERVRASLELAKTIPLAEIRAWIEKGLFTQRKGYAATAFRKALLHRWEEESPDDFLVWQIETGANTSSTALMGLAESRPELFNQIFRGLSAKNVGKALSSLAESRPELAWQFLRDPTTSSSSYYVEDALEQLAKEDLELMRAEIDKLPFSLRKQAREAFYQELFKRDFTGAIDELIELPNGVSFLKEAFAALEDPSDFFDQFSRFPQSWKNKFDSNFGYSIDIQTKEQMEQWLSFDWQGNGMSKHGSERLLASLLNKSSSRYPEETLSRLNSLELEKNTRESVLRQLFRNIEKGEDRDRLLSQLTNETDLSYVSGILEKDDERVVRSSSPKPTDTLELLTQLEALHAEKDTNSNYVSYGSLDYYVDQWKPEEKKVLAAHFEEAQGEEKALLAAFFLELRDRGEKELVSTGLEYFLTNEEARKASNLDDSKLIRSTSSHVLALMRNDTDDATAWADKLPEGDIRIYTKFNLVQNWQGYDPAAAEAWLSRQPANELSKIRELLK